MKRKNTVTVCIIVLVIFICAIAVMYNYFRDSNTDGIDEDTTGQQSQIIESEGNVVTSDGIEIEDDRNTNGGTAPDFTVIDNNGNRIKLSDMKGKPTVLNFWASWCGPCKSEMPDFEKVYSEYGEDINFMMVNLTDGERETVESAYGYIKSLGYSFPVYYDTAGEGAAAYSLYSIPCTYFIDADGNVVSFARGAIDEETLKSGIDMIRTETE